MLAEIESAAIARLGEKIPQLPHVDSMKNVLTEKMAYTLAIMEGPAEPVTIGGEETRQRVKLSLWVAFKNLKSDEDRRKGVFLLLEGIAQMLLGQKLGLDIKRLKYTGFSDVTDPAERQAGQTIYQVNFETSYTVTRLDEEGTEELLKVGLSYLLNGSASAAAGDVVELQTQE